MVHRRVLQCGYAESKRNVLRLVLNVFTDGAVWGVVWVKIAEMKTFCSFIPIGMQ